MSFQITPPCMVCGKPPVTDEEWISVARWRAGHAVELPTFDPKTGQVLEPGGPGEFHGETTGHLACLAPRVSALLAPNVYSTGKIDLGAKRAGKGRAS